MKMKILLIMNLVLFFYTISQAQQTGTEQNTASITGRVRSQMNQSPIRSITVRIIGSEKGAITNPEGFFEIKNLPFGIYSVQFTGVGYEKYVETDIMVGSGKKAFIEVDLAEKIVQLPGAEVRASYFTKRVETATSTQVLNYDDIRRTPGVQEDVIRAASLLPGVASAQAGRNDLIVRGGSPFENLFIVDNIEIPNINHFGSQGTGGGPLALINLDFVKNVSFSSGAFGARYGDKVSSITNISLRNGNEQQTTFKANLSATGFGLNIEGPANSRSSYFLSVRRSYLDIVFKAAGFAFIPEYWDIIGKFNYRLDNNNSISFLTIGALDRITLNNDDADKRFNNSRFASPSENQYFSGLTWKSVFSSGFLTVTLGRNYTYYNTYQNDSNLIEIFRNKSEESENILRTDLDLQLSPVFNLTIGNQGKYSSRLKYDIKLAGFNRIDNFGVQHPLRVDTNFTSYRNGTYTSLTTALGSFKITLGGRLDYYNYLDTKVYLSPRASLIYQLNDVSGFSLSAGRYYQSPSMIWFMGSEDNEQMKPIRSDQIVLGYDHTPREDVKVQVEGYYKWYGNYPARLWRPATVLAPSGFDDASLDIPFGLEPLSSTATGFSRGFEIFIQKKYSEVPLYSLLSLTLSETKFISLDKVEHYGTFDTRFIFNFVLGYRIGADWEFSGKFRFSTGLPTSPYLPTGQPDYTKLNEERLPSYHSLDLRVDKRWDFTSFMMVTYLDVQNIYGRKNVSDARWNQRTGQVEYQTSFGVFPTIGIAAEF